MRPDWSLPTCFCWINNGAEYHTYELSTGAAVFQRPESGDGEMSGEHLGTLLRQVSKASMGEIESLIVELKTLHKKLQTDGDRIQRDIGEYAELSQQVMQLTTIISDSVSKLPRGSGISR
jgi:hypothetical protein